MKKDDKKIRKARRKREEEKKEQEEGKEGTPITGNSCQVKVKEGTRNFFSNTK